MNGIISFVAYIAYLTLESYLRHTGKYSKMFNYVFLPIGVVGLIVTNLVKVFYLETFFFLVMFMSARNLWRERNE